MQTAGFAGTGQSSSRADEDSSARAGLTLTSLQPPFQWGDTGAPAPSLGVTSQDSRDGAGFCFCLGHGLRRVRHGSRWEGLEGNGTRDGTGQLSQPRRGADLRRRDPPRSRGRSQDRREGSCLPAGGGRLRQRGVRRPSRSGRGSSEKSVAPGIGSCCTVGHACGAATGSRARLLGSHILSLNKTRAGRSAPILGRHVSGI